MSWQRWQFWLFAATFSFVVVPVVEELLFRGYYQRRLAEDWGDAPAILGTTSLFVFAHKQYLIANLYSAGMVLSLSCVALGLGIVFACTRSLIPSMIAHAIINIPMTPKFQIGFLALFALVLVIFWRKGTGAVKQVFSRPTIASCALLALIGGSYAVLSQHFAGLSTIAVALLALALGLEWKIRREEELSRPVI